VDFNWRRGIGAPFSERTTCIVHHWGGGAKEDAAARFFGSVELSPEAPPDASRSGGGEYGSGSDIGSGSLRLAPPPTAHWRVPTVVSSDGLREQKMRRPLLQWGSSGGVHRGAESHYPATQPAAAADASSEVATGRGADGTAPTLLRQDQTLAAGIAVPPRTDMQNTNTGPHWLLASSIGAGAGTAMNGTGTATLSTHKVRTGSAGSSCDSSFDRRVPTPAPSGTS
jgi:hypothetical protein